MIGNLFDRHPSFLSDKINFLMHATRGFSNINQLKTERHEATVPGRFRLPMLVMALR